MAVNEGASQESTTPRLSYQSWDDFHSDTNGSDSFSIDILLSSQQDGEKSTDNGATPAKENVELPERIRINSNYLIQILTKFRGSSHSEDAPTIMFRPYKTLLFFEEEIRHTAAELEQKAQTPSATSSPTDFPSGTGDEVRLAHLRCLIQFMDTHLSTRIAFLQTPESQTIFFSDLWLLYKPGDFVISRDLCQAHQVIKVDTKRSIIEQNGKLVMEDDSFIIHCVCVDFDGEWLGPVVRKVVMKAWGLSKNVESLEVIPLTRAIAGKKVLKQDLIKRGQTFVQVAGVSPIHYDGCTLDSKVQVNGTVIVDFEEALRDEEDFKTWRTTIEHSLAEARIFATGIDGDDNEAHAYSFKHGYKHEDSYVDDMRHQNYIRSQLIVRESGDRVPSIVICARRLSQAGLLTEEELLITSNRAFGYILDIDNLFSRGNWGEFPTSGPEYSL